MIVYISVFNGSIETSIHGRIALKAALWPIHADWLNWIAPIEAA